MKHAVLVSLAEKSASGYDLARRFDKSLGFFLKASHQQIYRVLAQLHEDGQVAGELHPGVGKPDRIVYHLTPNGWNTLHDWTAEPSPVDRPRSEFAAKVRGMNHGDRAAVIADIERQREAHQHQLELYQRDAARNFPYPGSLNAAELPVYLVLRGGIRTEESYVAWCTEMLDRLPPVPTPGPSHQERS